MGGLPWLIRRPPPSHRLVLAAVIGTAAWAGLSAAQSLVGEAVPPAAVFALDVLRYALWLARPTVIERTGAAPGTSAVFRSVWNLSGYWRE